MKNSKRQIILKSTIPARALKLVGEWQERGPETLSGLAIRKLRLSFAPTQSVLIAIAAV